MDKEELYKATIAPPAPGIPFIKADPPPLVTPAVEAKEEEGIDRGVVIIPPQEGQHNKEMEAYPADYVRYCQGRMREHKRQTGELPRWK